MISIRKILAVLAVCAVSACTSQALLPPEVAGRIAVQEIAVSTTGLERVTGRDIAVSNAQVQADIRQALAARMQGRGAVDGSPVNVTVNVDSVSLVSPGQSLLVGGVSSISGSITITDVATGAVILPLTAVRASSEGWAPGGILGATSRGTAEADYAQTVASFANSIATRVLGTATSATTGAPVTGTAPTAVSNEDRNAFRASAWQL